MLLGFTAMIIIPWRKMKNLIALLCSILAKNITVPDGSNTAPHRNLRYHVQVVSSSSREIYRPSSSRLKEAMFHTLCDHIPNRHHLRHPTSGSVFQCDGQQLSNNVSRNHFSGSNFCSVEPRRPTTTAYLGTRHTLHAAYGGPVRCSNVIENELQFQFRPSINGSSSIKSRVQIDESMKNLPFD